jgi:hypothetical protein
MHLHARHRVAPRALRLRRVGRPEGTRRRYVWAHAQAARAHRNIAGLGHGVRVRSPLASLDACIGAREGRTKGGCAREVAPSRKPSAASPLLATRDSPPSATRTPHQARPLDSAPLDSAGHALAAKRARTRRVAAHDRIFCLVLLVRLLLALLRNGLQQAQAPRWASPPAATRRPPPLTGSRPACGAASTSFRRIRPARRSAPLWGAGGRAARRREQLTGCVNLRGAADNVERAAGRDGTASADAHETLDDRHNAAGSRRRTAQGGHARRRTSSKGEHARGRRARLNEGVPSELNGVRPVVGVLLQTQAHEVPEHNTQAQRTQRTQLRRAGLGAVRPATHLNLSDQKGRFWSRTGGSRLTIARISRSAVMSERGGEPSAISIAVIPAHTQARTTLISRTLPRCAGGGAAGYPVTRCRS